MFIILPSEKNRVKVLVKYVMSILKKFMYIAQYRHSGTTRCLESYLIF